MQERGQYGYQRILDEIDAAAKGQDAIQTARMNGLPSEKKEKKAPRKDSN